MERLTDRSNNQNDCRLSCLGRCYNAGDCINCDSFENAVYRLAAYEDTGLTPEEIKNLKTGGIPAHWGELFKAECDGRLVVMPCKPGDTVYRIAHDEDGNPYIVKDLCAGIRIGLSGDLLMVTLGDRRLNMDKFGKSIFLTREAAEAALKEREILFRGKRMDNGKWVEGWFCKYPFGRWPLKVAIIPSQDAEDGHFEFVEVDPSTVGQYTGLTDKNGKLIFEGDIMEGDLHDERDPSAKWRMEVTWLPFGWGGANQYGAEIMNELDCKEGEVIGNIHDDPELLERGSNEKDYM